MKGAGLLGVMDGWVWWMAGQGGEFFRHRDDRGTVVPTVMMNPRRGPPYHFGVVRRVAGGTGRLAPCRFCVRRSIAGGDDTGRLAPCRFCIARRGGEPSSKGGAGFRVAGAGFGQRPSGRVKIGARDSVDASSRRETSRSNAKVAFESRSRWSM